VDPADDFSERNSDIIYRKNPRKQASPPRCSIAGRRSMIECASAAWSEAIYAVKHSGLHFPRKKASLHAV